MSLNEQNKTPQSSMMSQKKKPKSALRAATNVVVIAKGKNVAQSDKSLLLQIDELLNEVNDFLWLWHGRPIWVWRKVRYAPGTITIEDRIHIQSFLEKMPDETQLLRLKQTILVQLPATEQRKDRISKLERALINTKHGREFLQELLAKIDKIIGEKSQQVIQRQLSQLSLSQSPVPRQSSSRRCLTGHSPMDRRMRSKERLIALLNHKNTLILDLRGVGKLEKNGADAEKPPPR